MQRAAAAQGFGLVPAGVAFSVLVGLLAAVAFASLLRRPASNSGSTGAHLAQLDFGRRVAALSRCAQIRHALYRRVEP